MPPIDLNQFRQEVLKRNPNITTSQLGQLDQFVQQKQAQQLVASGRLTLEQAAKPGVAQLAAGIPGTGPLGGGGGQTPKQQASKRVAERVVGQLEGQFLGKPETGDELAKGRIFGLLSSLSALAGFNPRLKTFQATRGAARPTLARAAGEVGALTEAEQEAAIAQIPTQFSTQTEALQGFAALRERLGLGPSQFSGVSDLISTAQPTPTSPTQAALNQQGTQQQQTIDPRIQQALNEGFTIEEIQQFLGGQQ